MNFLGSFEKNFLFSFTRILTHILIGLLVLGIIGSAIFLFKYDFPNSRVTYDEVISTLQSPYKASTNEQSDDKTQESAPTEQEKAAFRASFFKQYSVPLNVQKGFSSDENFRVLQNWLSALNDNEKQDFLQNLSEMVSKAIDSNPNTVDEVVNQYAQLKNQRIQEYHSKEALLLAEKCTIILTALGSAGLIALFTLILVLLAVERNTRPTSPNA